MTAIETFFLRAKHWQIFLLLVGIGFIADAAAMSSIAARSSESLKISLPFCALTALFMFCFLG